MAVERRCAEVDTSVGRLFAIAGPDGLESLRFADGTIAPGDAVVDPALGRRVRAAVESYLRGEETTLDLAPTGTAFRKRVWRELRKIPYGQTRSYGAIAQRVGSPGAARAVGGACGANPIAILIPCHRVLAEGGGLGGYYWGLDVKRRLLQAEGAWEDE